MVTFLLYKQNDLLYVLCEWESSVAHEYHSIYLLHSVLSIKKSKGMLFCWEMSPFFYSLQEVGHKDNQQSTLSCFQY